MDTVILILTVCMVCPAVVALIVALNSWDKRVARRVQARYGVAAPAPEPPGQWIVSLLVDADERSGILRPILQLLGPRLPPDVTVELDVGKHGGHPYLGTRRHFESPAPNTDLVLGTLSVPDDLSMARAAREDWTIVVSHGGREIARRRGPLIPAPGLNDEAELNAPDLDVDTELGFLITRPARTTRTPVRRLGRTIGLTIAACALLAIGDLTVMQSVWLCLPGALLIGMAGVLAFGASLTLFVPCPLCGEVTAVLGRNAMQRCEVCESRFILMPSAM